jgi:hypothetical protein
MAHGGTRLAIAMFAGRVGHSAWGIPTTFFGRDVMTYQKPAVQRFGSLRELTLGGGAQLAGDATNLYHRS